MSTLQSLALVAMAFAGVINVSVAKDISSGDAVFYGQSPPFYPSRQLNHPGVCLYFVLTLFSAMGTGTGSWAGAYKKAKALVAQMTHEEKVCPI
jgi:beta-glucosidase